PGRATAPCHRSADGTPRAEPAVNLRTEVRVFTGGSLGLGGGSAVLGGVAEGDGAVVARLLGEAEDALAQDVALHLVGAAVDRRRRREERELGDDASGRVGARLLEHGSLL